MIRRREFIALFGGAAVAWPLAARTQQVGIPTIGWLSARSPDEAANTVAAFQRGLNSAGYIVGRNVAMEYRWAGGQYDRLPAMARELVNRQVAVIVAVGAASSWTAAKSASSTVPIVFGGGADPVRLGVVASLNRPGGNATGINYLLNSLASKLLQIVDELIPRGEPIAALINSDNPNAANDVQDMQEATQAIGRQIKVMHATTEREIDAAFQQVVNERIGALVVGSDGFFFSQRDRLVGLAARHKLPAIYFGREFVAAGGLMSYGSDLADGYRQVGIYAGRILKGEKPADLPVIQSSKFELLINLKTARTLGVAVPTTLLAIADEVIE